MTLRERTLGRSGLRVSDACLGTMTFGTGWGFGADEATCAEVYAAFREAGGNFVDTANLYTNGESEEITGRLIASERDSVVVATKFTLAAGADANSGGSHRKSLRRSVETSLRRLDTEYVDVLFVHAWDQRTDGEETVRALDDLVSAGKVLAVGISNTPAWVIARSDAIAELRGWSRFCALQLEYSLVARTADRELLPMGADRGMAVLAWSPLARGLLAGKPRLSGLTPLEPTVQAAVDATAKVATEIGVTSAQVALSWVWQHGLMPVLGARTLDQINDNLAAAELVLDAEHIARLDTASAVPLGYPHEFLRDRCPTLSADGSAARQAPTPGRP
jgi:aryl-alcohol dehydrogenase-like predicted oxidoreductase